MRRLLGVMAAGLLVAPMAMAAPAQTTAWASMVVKGTVVLAPDGHVTGYVLDQKQALPPGVVADLSKVVPQWRFEPVKRDGQAVAAQSMMHVRLLAQPLAGNKYAVRVAGVYFGKGQSDQFISAQHRVRPTYPRSLRRAGVTGTAYVVLQVGRDGKVAHAAVREVNLRTRGPARQMQRWRQALAQASIKALERWRFRTPSTGPLADAAHWTAVMPVNYELTNRRRPRYGQWAAYLPGPPQYIAWLNPHQIAAVGIGAMAGSGLYPVKQALHLISPVDGAQAASATH